MSKQKAQTAYGEVEYETVTCDSCGTEVMKKEAKRFIVGDLEGKKNWSHRSHVEYHVSDADLGWICPYCRDDGPIVGTPTTSRIRKFVREYPEFAYAAFCIGTLFGLMGIGVLLS